MEIAVAGEGSIESVMSMTRIPDSALSILILRLKARSFWALKKIADAFELVERGSRGDDQNLIEAEPLQAHQPLARLVGQTDERDLGAFGETAGFGPGAQVDDDIGQHGVDASGFAIEAHAVFEIIPAAVEARGDPALALFCRVSDPAWVAPGAQQYRRPALASGPGRQGPAVDRLAPPGPPHYFQRAHQGAEAPLVIGTEEI